jgi:cytochrome c oxidase cbb3-type subunit 3/ubiquinol-cytochrome c reductase cytochrome c subunit
VFRTQCESCHGTPNQRRTAVHLANAMFLETASDEFLRVAIEQGRPGTKMEAWSGKLKRREDRRRRRLSAIAGTPGGAVAAERVGRCRSRGFLLRRRQRGRRASELYPAREPVTPRSPTSRRRTRKSQRLVIVDARTPADYLRLHIAGAISIPYYDMHDLDKIPNDGTWVIAYCACPHHVSGIVVDELRKRGYEHSAVLDEGVFVWQQQGNPIVAAPGQLPVAAPPVETGSKAAH